MMRGAVIDSASEPASLWMPDADPDAAGITRRRFEYTSRGDRVPGVLLLPKGPGPFPLVLLQHGAGGSKDAPYLDPVRRPWAERGLAVASIDFPLHGERSSAKLTEQLLATLAARSANASGLAVFEEFARQAVTDLARALDALAPLPAIDAARIGYAAFSLGAILGSLFVPYDERVLAAAMAVGGAGIGPPTLDPVAHIGRFAPRPLLFVNATRDERIPRAAAEALHGAALDPKEVLWFDAGHADLPGRAVKAMWTFLATHLGVA
jgi:uncharacterized protein